MCVCVRIRPKIRVEGITIMFEVFPLGLEPKLWPQIAHRGGRHIL